MSDLSAKESPDAAATDPSADRDDSTELLNLRLIHLGQVVREFSANADASDGRQLGELLRGAARRHGGHDGALSNYELEVRRPGSDVLITRFAAL